MRKRFNRRTSSLFSFNLCCLCYEKSTSKLRNFCLDSWSMLHFLGIYLFGFYFCFKLNYAKRHFVYFVFPLIQCDRRSWLKIIRFHYFLWLNIRFRYHLWFVITVMCREYHNLHSHKAIYSLILLIRYSCVTSHYFLIILCFDGIFCAKFCVCNTTRFVWQVLR
jgi:hypothetical protein